MKVRIPTQWYQVFDSITQDPIGYACPLCGDHPCCDNFYAEPFNHFIPQKVTCHFCGMNQKDFAFEYSQSAE
jgi:hypothetical protein